MADHDDTYDDKYSRGKVSCPSFNGQARDWKSWLTKMRAYARVRGPVARDIIDLKRPPTERRQEYYDSFASDVGGWDELRKLDNPSNIARYSRRVNQLIQEAQDVWDRVSNDLFSRMILCFEDEALSTIETLEEGDVPGALRVFRERYGKETEQGRYQMLRRFFNLTMTGSSARKLEEHIAIFKALISDLKKLNPPEEPSEGQKVAAFLGSLEAACPDLAKVTVAARRGRDGTLTIDEVIGMARQWMTEGNGAETSESESENEEALAVRGTFKGECWNCGKRGHTRANCPSEKKSRSEGKGSKSKQASKRKRKRERAAAAKAKAEKKKKAGKKARVMGVWTQHAYSALKKSRKTKRKKSSKSVVLLDSQASAHFINDKSLMSSVKDAEVEVVLADGASADVAKKGNLRAKFTFADDSEQLLMTRGGAYYTPDFVASLLSGQKLVQDGHVVHLDKQGSYVALNGSSKKKDRIPIKMTDAGFEISVEGTKKTRKARKKPRAMAAATESKEESKEDSDPESEEESDAESSSTGDAESDSDE